MTVDDCTVLEHSYAVRMLDGRGLGWEDFLRGTVLHCHGRLSFTYLNIMEFHMIIPSMCLYLCIAIS